mmetsp:Transcript_48021/g.104551  ORF Transcript_48021/g.104551 Transcript_48021/m.104551 type:complete len:427 (-) Transcript_48021:117-1397(-)
MTMMGPEAPGVPDLAELRSFLCRRCGNLREAFAHLDKHGVGRIASDRLDRGLAHLGYTGNTSAAFKLLHDGSGLISLDSFLMAFGESESFSTMEPPSKLSYPSSPCTSIGSRTVGSRTLDVSTELPRRGLGDSGRMRISEHDPSARSGLPSTLERSRRELFLLEEHEAVIAKRVADLVGLRFSEQIDAVRDQLTAEAQQRKADVEMLRNDIEAATGNRPRAAETALMAEFEHLRTSVNLRLQSAEAKCSTSSARESPGKQDPLTVLPEVEQLLQQRFDSLRKEWQAKLEERLRLWDRSLGLGVVHADNHLDESSNVRASVEKLTQHLEKLRACDGEGDRGDLEVTALRLDVDRLRSQLDYLVLALEDPMPVPLLPRSGQVSATSSVVGVSRVPDGGDSVGSSVAQVSRTIWSRRITSARLPFPDPA